MKEVRNDINGTGDIRELGEFIPFFEYEKDGIAYLYRANKDDWIGAFSFSVARHTTSGIRIDIPMMRSFFQLISLPGDNISFTLVACRDYRAGANLDDEDAHANGNGKVTGGRYRRATLEHLQKQTFLKRYSLNVTFWRRVKGKQENFEMEMAAVRSAAENYFRSLDVKAESDSGFLRNLFELGDSSYVENYCGDVREPGARWSALFEELRKDMVFASGDFARVLTVDEFPDAIRCGFLDEIAHALPQVRIVVNISVPEPAAVKRHLWRKKWFVFRQQRSGDTNPENDMLKLDLDGLLGAMVKGTISVLKVRTVIVVSGDSREEVQQSSEKAREIAGKYQYRLFEETVAKVPVYVSSLPACHNPEQDVTFKIDRMLTNENLAVYVPAYGESSPWDKNQGVILLNRANSVCSIDIFARGTANHSLIFGMTGSGKSVLAQNMILAYRNVPTFIIDKGPNGSYKRIVEMLGGKYFTIAETGFDPFPKIGERFLRGGKEDREEGETAEGCALTEEDLSILTEIVAQATGYTSKLGEAAIVRAIKVMYSQKNADALKSMDVREALRIVLDGLDNCKDVPKEVVQMGKEIAVVWGDYVDGRFAHLFAGSKLSYAGEKIVAMELAGDDSAKDSLACVLLCILYGITQACTRVAGPKLVVIDEAWSLLDTEQGGKFLKNIFKTFRKYGAACVLVTQQAHDLDSPAGKAVLLNSTNKFMLKQPREVLELLKKSDLHLDEEDFNAIVSLVQEKGKRSQLLYVGEKDKGVYELRQSPLVYPLTTTDPGEIETIVRMKAQGKSLEEIGTALCSHR